MIVKCVENRRDFLSLSVKRIYTSPQIESITIGKQYVAYAVHQLTGTVEYCICNDIVSYPLFFHSDFFEVTDHQISRYWVFSQKKLDSDEVDVFLSFPEWRLDNYFYDSLTDGEDEEVRIFRLYKSLMDLEFSDPSITESAEIGDENWLICPTCMDAWESRNTLDGMVICPICKKTLHNPRYKKFTFPKPINGS